MPEPTRRALSVDDLLTFKVVSEVQIAPDGSEVAFVVAEPVKIDTKTPKSRIWIVPTAGGAARELTTGPRTDTSPRWSPDGRMLAFFSDRLEDGQPQLYLLPRDGGEATQLLTVAGHLGAGRGADSLQWSPDGTALAFQMRDPEADAAKQRQKDKDDPIEVEQNPRFTRVWSVDVATREARAVTPPGLQVWEFSWSPDGQQLALLVSELPEEWSWYQARVARISRTGGDVVEVYASRRQLARPIFSPDGRQIVVVESIFSDRGAVGGDLIAIPLDGGEPHNLTDGLRCSPATVEWSSDGTTLLVLAHADGGIGLLEVDPVSGEHRNLRVGPFGVAESSWPRFSRARDGTLAVAREDPTSPREVWIARPGSGGDEWQQLTRLNAHAADLAVGAVESIRWEAPDGLAIQGFLILPVGYEPGRRYPTVTWVHGGPTSAYNARFYGTSSPGLLAAHGFAVFLPNPRGSLGWGRAFAEANVGDMGGKDWEDILAGLDYLVTTGVADPDRLGIGGWSYGGFMTAWAVTQTSRFKAAVMGAGIAAWRSFHGSSHLSAWDALHYAADPYEIGGLFDRFSPITYVKAVRTPTLIVHGENDRDVPVSQGYEFFRALKDLGVETQLVIYPREGHGFVEKNHVLDLNRRIVGWYEAHL